MNLHIHPIGLALVNGVASCALTAGQLPADRYQIVAVYSGDADFGATFSPANPYGHAVLQAP